MNRIFWTLLSLSLLSSCMYAQKTEAEFHEMLDGMYKQTVPLLKETELQKNTDNYVILDTREPEEFVVSHIPGAQLAGYDEFDPALVQDWPKDQKILVYCSVGYRSERIGEQLQEMGFTEVYNLYGGIFEWKNHGHEVQDEQGKATEKVHTYNRKWSQWLRVGEKVY
jgi:rhodanese-related sulfurtransferase